MSEIEPREVVDRAFHRVISYEPADFAEEDGQIVGKGDLKVQAHKAAENLVAALKGAGASLADVVKMNTYVVNYKQDDYRAINDMRREFFPKENPPASTLIGVAALAVDGLLIEIEAVAALP